MNKQTTFTKKFLAMGLRTALVALSPGLEAWAHAASLFEAGSMAPTPAYTGGLRIIDPTAGAASGAPRAAVAPLLGSHGLRSRFAPRHPGLAPAQLFQEQKSLPPPVYGRRAGVESVVGMGVEAAETVQSLDGLDRKALEDGVSTLGWLFERFAGSLRYASPTAFNGVAPAPWNPAANHPAWQNRGLVPRLRSQKARTGDFKTLATLGEAIYTELSSRLRPSGYEYFLFRTDGAWSLKLAMQDFVAGAKVYSQKKTDRPERQRALRELAEVYSEIEKQIRRSDVRLGRGAVSVEITLGGEPTSSATLLAPAARNLRAAAAGSHPYQGSLLSRIAKFMRRALPTTPSAYNGVAPHRFTPGWIPTNRIQRAARRHGGIDPRPMPYPSNERLGEMRRAALKEFLQDPKVRKVVSYGMVVGAIAAGVLIGGALESAYGAAFWFAAPLALFGINAIPLSAYRPRAGGLPWIPAAVLAAFMVALRSPVTFLGLFALGMVPVGRRILERIERRTSRSGPSLADRLGDAVAKSRVGRALSTVDWAHIGTVVGRTVFVGSAAFLSLVLNSMLPPYAFILMAAAGYVLMKGAEGRDRTLNRLGAFLSLTGVLGGAWIFFTGTARAATGATATTAAAIPFLAFPKNSNWSAKLESLGDKLFMYGGMAFIAVMVPLLPFSFVVPAVPQVIGEPILAVLTTLLTAAVFTCLTGAALMIVGSYLPGGSNRSKAGSSPKPFNGVSPGVPIPAGIFPAERSREIEEVLAAARQVNWEELAFSAAKTREGMVALEDDRQNQVFLGYEDGWLVSRALFVAVKLKGQAEPVGTFLKVKSLNDPEVKALVSKARMSLKSAVEKPARDSGVDLEKAKQAASALLATLDETFGPQATAAAPVRVYSSPQPHGSYENVALSPDGKYLFTGGIEVATEWKTPGNGFVAGPLAAILAAASFAAGFQLGPLVMKGLVKLWNLPTVIGERMGLAAGQFLNDLSAWIAALNP